MDLVGMVVSLIYFFKKSKANIYTDSKGYKRFKFSDKLVHRIVKRGRF